MKTSRRLFPLLVLAMALVGHFFGQVSPAGAAEYNITKVTADDYAGFAFNNLGHVAWGGGFHSGAYTAWLYRADNSLIYSGIELVEFLQMNDRDEVVWDNLASSTGDIYLYSDGTTRRITHHDTDNTDHARPQINNRGDIAWKEYNLNGARVVLIRGGEPFFASPYTKGGISNAPLSLNNLGQLVWAQRDPTPGEQFQIFFYDGVNPTPQKLTDDALGNDYPLINDRGDIIWTRASNVVGQSDLRHYRDGVYTTITNLLVSNWPSYALNNLGEIAWMAAGTPYGQKLHVYYDGADHLMNHNQVVTYYYPALNNQGMVAYVVVGGKVALTNFRTGATKELTGSGVSGAAVVKINDRGQVAWQETLNLDFCNLYLASPRTTVPSVNLLLLGN